MQTLFAKPENERGMMMNTEYKIRWKHHDDAIYKMVASISDTLELDNQTCDEILWSYWSNQDGPEYENEDHENDDFCDFLHIIDTFVWSRAFYADHVDDGFWAFLPYYPKTNPPVKILINGFHKEAIAKLDGLPKQEKETDE